MTFIDQAIKHGLIQARWQSGKKTAIRRVDIDNLFTKIFAVDYPQNISDPAQRKMLLEFFEPTKPEMANGKN